MLSNGFPPHRYLIQNPVDDIHSTITPWSINRNVNKIMRYKNTKYGDHPKPFLPLINTGERKMDFYIDTQRAELTWEKWQIPELKKVLENDVNTEALIAALNSLVDLLKNPTKCCIAIEQHIECSTSVTEQSFSYGFQYRVIFNQAPTSITSDLVFYESFCEDLYSASLFWCHLLSLLVEFLTHVHEQPSWVIVLGSADEKMSHLPSGGAPLLHSIQSQFPSYSSAQVINIKKDRDPRGELMRLIVWDCEAIKALVLVALNQLCNQPSGKSMILNNDYFMTNIKMCFNSEEEAVRIECFTTIRKLATNWFGVEKLIEHNFLPMIMDKLLRIVDGVDEEDIMSTVTLLDTAEKLIGFNDTTRFEGIRYNAYRLIPFLSHYNKEIRDATFNIFSELFNIPEGVKGGFIHDVLSVLSDFLSLGDPSTAILTLTMFAIIPSEIRPSFITQPLIKDLTKKYSEMKNKNDTKCTLILNILTTLAEVPSGKAHLKQFKSRILENTDSTSHETERRVKQLIDKIYNEF